MAISSVMVWSCKPLEGASLQENATQEPISALQALVVDQPNMAASPPIAQDFIIQQLERADLNGNNLLFKAIFNPKEPRLLNVPSFSVLVSEGVQVLLHDDGRDGDDVAGDRIFSSFVKDDIARLTTFLNNKNVELERNRLLVTKLSGREMIPSKATMIDMTAFAARKPIFLGGGTTLATVTAADFNVLKDHSLVITDLGVVQDPTRTYNPCIGGTAGGNPNGAWTFKTLMTNMANSSSTGVSVDNFVMNWVDTELFGAKTQATSGDITTPPIRDNMASATSSKRIFITSWLLNAGLPLTASNFTNWRTVLANKLEFFPVRLLAIVNRLDLRGNFGYTGGTANGGEGRFVFCFVDRNNGCSATNTFKKMTIILEYGIPITDCNGLKNYAQQWYNLKNFTLNGTVNATYNAALQAVTNVFTNLNAGGTAKPNGSALNHLRTNEFLTSPWNIRDFAIQSASHQLALIHPNKEPMSEANVNSSPTLAAKIASLVSFVNNSPNTNLIETEGNYAIPDDIKAIDAQIPSPSATPPYFWNAAAITSDLARHKLSLGACSGCHARETNTGFTHIFPANFGTPAPLSSFITGLGTDDEGTDIDTDPMGLFWIKDPASRPTFATAPKRAFNELLRRANDLETLRTSACGTLGTTIGLANILQFQPLSAD